MKRIIRLTESDLTRIVRRVIKEQQSKEDSSIKAIMDQVAGILNAQIDAKIKTDPKFPNIKLSVERKSDATDTHYKFKYGNTPIGEAQRVSSMLTSNGPRIIGNSIIQTFNINYNKELPSNLQQLPQPGLKQAVNTWVAQFTTPTKP
jgi:hypothetical protein